LDENRMPICVVCLMGGCPRVFFPNPLPKNKTHVHKEDSVGPPSGFLITK